VVKGDGLLCPNCPTAVLRAKAACTQRNEWSYAVDPLDRTMMPAKLAGRWRAVFCADQVKQSVPEDLETAVLTRKRRDLKSLDRPPRVHLEST
jgi:hypothetical protein